MSNFIPKISASSLRQVVSILAGHDANKYLNFLCNSGLRQVFAPSARQVRQAILQVIDFIASSLRQVCAYISKDIYPVALLEPPPNLGDTKCRDQG